MVKSSERTHSVGRAGRAGAVLTIGRPCESRNGRRGHVDRPNAVGPPICDVHGRAVGRELAVCRLNEPRGRAHAFKRRGLPRAGVACSRFSREDRHARVGRPGGQVHAFNLRTVHVRDVQRRRECRGHTQPQAASGRERVVQELHRLGRCVDDLDRVCKPLQRQIHDAVAHHDPAGTAGQAAQVRCDTAEGGVRRSEAREHREGAERVRHASINRTAGTRTTNTRVSHGWSGPCVVVGEGEHNYNFVQRC